MQRHINFLVSLVFSFLILGQFDCQSARSQEARNYVLVHGAWVGEWYWAPLAERLRADGHHVFLVSLRGHGLQSAEGGPDTSVRDHGDDIVEVMEKNNLEQVYLIAHSYGGKPATIAWDIARTRIRHIVYIDAFTPLGEDLDVIPRQGNLMEFLEKDFPDIAASGMMPVRAQMRQELKDRATPQSLRTLVDPVVLMNGPLPENTDRTFILATENESRQFIKIAAQLRADPKWTVLELQSGHDVMKEAADQLAQLLIELP